MLEALHLLVAETVFWCIGPAAEKRDESDATDTMSGRFRMIKSW